jgi:hypothetical protein
MNMVDPKEQDVVADEGTNEVVESISTVTVSEESEVVGGE